MVYFEVQKTTEDFTQGQLLTIKEMQKLTSDKVRQLRTANKYHNIVKVNQLHTKRIFGQRFRVQ